jgi:ABC-2 type transport system permease protein
LRVLTRLDPLTYAVDPMRRVIIDALPAHESAQLSALDPGVTWLGWTVPVGVEVGLLAVFGLVALVAAAMQFNRAD